MSMFACALYNRHRGKEDNSELLCVVLSVTAWCMCCGSVQLIISTARGDSYADFEMLNTIEYVLSLGCEPLPLILF